MNDLTMGQRIAEERKKLGLSQEALGEKTGVSRQAISKWESDGAVPEIDKLIALSRLFGVSVGWLLGVEELPEQHSEELNETQLKMVEEIVRRYQPQKSPEDGQMKKAVLGSICLVFLAATLALTVLGLRRPDANVENLTNQISTLRQENSQIQSRLDEITEQLENMGRDAILTDYEMELLEVSLALEPDIPEPEHDVSLGTASVQVDYQVTFARLSLAALPQTRQEGDEAWLAVFLEGREITTIPLSWQGSAYRSEFVIPVSDGYEYCFVQSREGVQQMQYLKNTGCEDLKGLTDPTFTMFEPESITYDGKNLVFKTLTYSFSLSDFGLYNRWDWEKIDLVLMVNGEEVGRIEEGPWRQPSELGSSPGGLAIKYDVSFPVDGLQETDDIWLCIDTELSSGVTARDGLLTMALVDGKIHHSIIAY